MDPYRKYYDPDGSRKYQNRKPEKHQAELRLIDRAFASIPKQHRVLDVPCGGGRVMLHLAQHGYDVTGADVSEGMVQIAAETAAQNQLKCRVEIQDLEKLTYADRAFDTVVCFRLFHHFGNTDIRRRVIGELCRVAGKNVALSYFSPFSYTSCMRQLRAKLGGRKANKYATSLSEVTGYFATNGFRLVRDYAQVPFLHTLHVAVFERLNGAGQKSKPVA